MLQDKPGQGYISYGLFQDEVIIVEEFEPSTFGTILATTGGQASGLIGLFTVLIGGYQSFAFQKSGAK